MRRTGLVLLAGLAPLTLACQAPLHAAEKTVAAPMAERQSREGSGLKTAIFAGGCFWGVEAVFSHTRGVTSAISGYHGGTARSARYDLVSSGITDHAEVVKVTYDPRIIRYDQLLRIYFSVIADPTLRNRQGPDEGPQYRSALIPLSAEQRATATAYLAQLRRSGLWSDPIVTAIEPAGKFHAAEAYHQDFAAKNPRHAYIVRWDTPKVAALARLYPGVYRKDFRRS